MKSFFTALAVSLIMITGSQAQTMSRPKLFSAQPDILNCSSSVLEAIFTKTEGQSVQIPLSGDVVFSGRVISNIVKYSNLQTVTIQFPAYSDAVLHISKQTNPDNTFNYVGRLLHKDAGDGFTIERSGNNYAFKKVNAEKMLETCH